METGLVQTTGVDTPRRAAAARASHLFDTGPEEAFNRLTRLASMIVGTPMVALTVVDDVRSFLKGAPDPALLTGPEGTYESPVHETACQVVIETGGVVSAPDVRDDPRLRDLPQIHQFGAASWVGVPVRDPDGYVVGNFCAMDEVVREWSATDIEALQTLAAAAGGEIALRTALRTAEHHAGQAEELAEVLQQSLVPAGAPQVPGVDIGVRFRPGGSGVDVMGDFYDVVPVEGGFGVVLGDVIGKGVQAARTTGMARSVVRTAAHSQTDPVAVLQTLNEVLHAWFAGRVSFLTAQYATFLRPPVPAGAGAWLVRVAGGGHPAPYLRRADGTVEQLPGGGRALGLAPMCPIADLTIHLQPGDAVVFNTDGITEARRPGSHTQFEESGALDALTRLPTGPAADIDADAIAGAVADAAYRFSGNRADDDSGVVVVRIRPAGGA